MNNTISSKIMEVGKKAMEKIKERREGQLEKRGGGQ